ncbi:MAG: hypothetical protein E2O97_08565 [Acidobacteria bacterium]|nr:MAG: hypothetical protein E2O97_08565 [Acidobacteriota bacterium]
MGYGAVWTPEPPAGWDVLSFAAVVLSNTTNIVVAKGIAVIWIRHPTVSETLKMLTSALL